VVNAFARGNVANAQRALERARNLIGRVRNDFRVVQAAGAVLETLDGDLMFALEDLERAVVLDEMTEAVG